MSKPHIEDYRFGQIVIDGQAYMKDLIILPDRIVTGWWREEGHVLHPEDLGAVFDAQPEVLVVGQGAHGRMRVTRGVREALERAGIELIAKSSEQACQEYNALREQRSVAAALHLTC